MKCIMHMVTLQMTCLPFSNYAGGDFGTPNPNSFTFTAAQTTQCTDVPITDDTEIEVVETFDLLLAPVAGVLLSPATATVSIADNDGRLITKYCAIV